MSTAARSAQYNFVFWLHLAITILSWLLPFLFDWRLTLSVYAVVMLQFHVLGKCVMNAGHGLAETDDYTFYAHLFEVMGFKPDYPKVKRFVRYWKLPILTLFTLLWQLVWGFKPLIW